MHVVDVTLKASNMADCLIVFHKTLLQAAKGYPEIRPEEAVVQLKLLNQAKNAFHV